VTELADHRAAVCSDCGVLNETVLERLATRDRQIEQLDEDCRNLERELRAKRSQIKHLRSEQDASFKNDPHFEAAKRVLEHWRTTCHPNAKELSGDRLKNTIHRLRGDYAEADLVKSIDGYALKPFMVGGKRTHEGPQDAWRADAELIFRDAQHVDQGIRIAERADDLRQVVADAPESAQEPSSAPLGPLGEAALRLAGHGLLVFPVAEGQKVPATQNGLNDAKRDPNAIRRFWGRRPECNVGLRTGAGSGIVVLDVDGDEGFDSLHRLENKFGEIPTTGSVTTPRGGQHFYFLHPGFDVRNATGWPGPSLDLRGDGGYVLVPPSVIGGVGTYVPDDQVPPIALPDWLIDALKARMRSQASDLQGGRDWGAWLQAEIKAGRRNDAMTSYVGHLFAHGHDAGEVFQLGRVLNSAVKPPMSERELQGIVKSIAGREARAA
jgi:hypothetical protein